VPDVVVLRLRVDADRPDRVDRRPLVEERAADEAAVDLCGDAVEARVADQGAHAARGRPHRLEVVREGVTVGERGERLVENPPQLRDVVRGRAAEGELGGGGDGGSGGHARTFARVERAA
jgi:hypothetical protein